MSVPAPSGPTQCSTSQCSVSWMRPPGSSRRPAARSQAWQPSTLGGEETTDGIDDALDGRHVRVLELPVRIGNVVASYPKNRAAEVVDRLLREHGRDLGTVSARPG